MTEKKTSASSAGSGGGSFFTLLAIVFITLKLCGVIGCWLRSGDRERLC